MKQGSPEVSSSLCPYCSSAFGTFEEMKKHVISVHGTQPLPKPAGLIALTVNGQAHELSVNPEWTLYHVIHDVLGLTGVKMFCDRGVCGSCTAIVDGRPILSCMTLAIECDGKRIETAEGIAQANHPLVESYIKHHAMQCGYCTPGFITTAKALLDKNPDPSVEEVMEALGGNLCRCGTYPQHPKAVLEAAKTLKEGEQND